MHSAKYTLFLCNFLTVNCVSLWNDIVGLFTNFALSRCVHTDGPAKDKLNIVGTFTKNALSVYTHSAYKV